MHLKYKITDKNRNYIHDGWLRDQEINQQFDISLICSIVFIIKKFIIKRLSDK